MLRVMSRMTCRAFFMVKWISSRSSITCTARRGGREG
jgi:hypothetical protein